jgi:hypothetical protein
MTNGSGAAAILAAGVGSLVLALLAAVADKSAAVKNWMIFYKPTGALSGVTTVAIVVWLLVWVVLERRWRRKTVAIGRISVAAFVLLALSFLLTFPPVLEIL